MHGMDADEQLVRAPRMADEQLVHAAPHQAFGKVKQPGDARRLDLRP